MVIRHNTQCFRVDLMCIEEDEVPHIHIPMVFNVLEEDEVPYPHSWVLNIMLHMKPNALHLL